MIDLNEVNNGFTCYIQFNYSYRKKQMKNCKIIRNWKLCLLRLKSCFTVITFHGYNEHIWLVP